MWARPRRPCSQLLEGSDGGGKYHPHGSMRFVVTALGNVSGNTRKQEERGIAPSLCPVKARPILQINARAENLGFPYFISRRGPLSPMRVQHSSHSIKASTKCHPTKASLKVYSTRILVCRPRTVKLHNFLPGRSIAAAPPNFMADCYSGKSSTDS